MEGFLFKQGTLNVKRNLMSFKKHVTICAPGSACQISLLANMQDVQRVFECCFVQDPYAPIQTKSIPHLGTITYCCAKSIPLMIIASNELYDDPLFIPLDETFYVLEEG